jgi:hypothetical protein
MIHTPEMHNLPGAKDAQYCSIVAPSADGPILSLASPLFSSDFLQAL